MADAKAFTILAAVKTALEAINGVGSFNQKVDSVEIGLRPRERLTGLPALDIDAFETEHEYSQGSNNTLTTLGIFIRGAIKPSPDDDVTQEQWQLIKDIITAATLDITQGLSFVYDTRYTSTETDAGLVILDGYPRFVGVTLEVDYEHELEEF